MSKIWKNQALVDSTRSFRDEFESSEGAGPVNKIIPMQSVGNYIGKNVPTAFEKFKNLFKPNTKYRSVTPRTGTIGGAYDTSVDKLKGFFADKTGPIETGGAGGGSTLSGIAQYAGIASVGLAVGDFAGSYYNKRKQKRGKK